MEKILNIEEVSNVSAGKYSEADGYAITTDKQIIKLLIDNGQSCCENWGYFMSEDNLEQFIGADLLEITLTDTALNTRIFEEYNIDPDDKSSIMFVNINTTNGLLQFVAYNEHNGYYGHEAFVQSEQLKHSETL